MRQSTWAGPSCNTRKCPPPKAHDTETDRRRYVIADYDRCQFTIGEARFPDTPSATNLVNICATECHHGLSTGAIAGIAVGAAAIIGLVIAGFLFWLWRKRRGIKLEPDTRTIRSMGETTLAGEFEMSSIRGGERGEWYKPPGSPRPGSGFLDEDVIKPELDATVTAVGPLPGWSRGRHELDAGSDGQRPRHQHHSSWGSAGSGVSPISGVGGHRSYFGEPSPPMESGASSPPLSATTAGRNSRQHDRGHSMNSPRGMYELPE
jgi:hypothetical protein